MPFELVVLGCDGSYPGPGGAGSGYLLRSGSTTIWLDAGPGTLSHLQRHVDIADLDAVLLTHEHIDHWSDLEHLAVAAKYVIMRPPVPVYSCMDPLPLLRSGAGDVLSWQRIGPGSTATVGSFELTFSRTDHPVETLAVRASSGGRVLGYSADSGPGWELSQLGSGIHLALCEASYLSDREGSLAHLSARQAGATARAAAAERLVITHLWPTIDRGRAQAEAEATFEGPVTVAAIGQVHSV